VKLTNLLGQVPATSGLHAGYGLDIVVKKTTVYTRLLAALFYLGYGLYFACGLYAQHIQSDKVFA